MLAMQPVVRHALLVVKSGDAAAVDMARDLAGRLAGLGLSLGLLWLLFHRTRWGTRVRAATADREMVAALGVNQRMLFTTVFFLGSFLAGLGGALQIPRESVNLQMDLAIIAEAFVVVVIGGLGSLPSSSGRCRPSAS